MHHFISQTNKFLRKTSEHLATLRVGLNTTSVSPQNCAGEDDGLNKSWKFSLRSRKSLGRNIEKTPQGREPQFPVTAASKDVTSCTGKPRNVHCLGLSAKFAGLREHF